MSKTQVLYRNALAAVIDVRASWYTGIHTPVRRRLVTPPAGIFWLLSNEHIFSLAVPTAIVSLVATLTIGRRLDHFSYGIAPPIFSLVLFSILSIGITLLIISFQTIKITLFDPVKALRYEGRRKTAA